MHSTVTKVAGLLAGLVIAVAPLAAGSQAFAAQLPTAPASVLTAGAAVRHATGVVTDCTVTVQLTEKLPDGAYFFTLGWLIDEGSVAAMRTFVIHGGKVVSGEGRINAAGTFTTRIPVAEMAYYPMSDEEQHQPAYLHRFPRTRYARYLMGMIDLNTGKSYEVKLQLKER